MKWIDIKAGFWDFWNDSLKRAAVGEILLIGKIIPPALHRYGLTGFLLPKEPLL